MVDLVETELLWAESACPLDVVVEAPVEVPAGVDAPLSGEPELVEVLFDERSVRVGGIG